MQGEGVGNAQSPELAVGLQAGVFMDRIMGRGYRVCDGLMHILLIG